MSLAHKPWSFVITMAGLGSRFRRAGYDRPKYMIATCGKTLFEWALEGLAAMARPGDVFVFIARREDSASAFIKERCAALGIADPVALELDAPTDGQATTALAAMPLVPAHHPMAIFNIDTGLAPGVLRREMARGAGWIPCFRAPGDGWSFCRADEQGRVLEVREKSRISEFATIGFYWFDSARRYRESYDAYYGVAGREEKGERYVAPLYNDIIASDGAVWLSEVEREGVIALGTPEDVKQFEQRQADPD